jgi:DNA repair exonuclease SbcCD ATPase subunit
MEIVLKKLTLVNFKGIRNLTIELGQQTNIFGRNEAGKTTIADASRWLLFGKDSTDRADFEIKTLDSRNLVIPKLSHEVEGVFEINGSEETAKKVLEEKWEKKRGTSEAVFTGNQTAYFWNGVPLKQGEYQAKIGSLLDERVFKLITNALHFNDSLKWEDRRSVLIQIAGNITDHDIAAGDTEYEQLLSEIGKETLKDFKAKKNTEKKKLKEALETLPTRIDEATRSMPDPIDFAVVEKNIAGKKNELAGIESQLSDKVSAMREKHDAINVKQGEILGLRTKISLKEYGIKTSHQEKILNREREIGYVRSQLRTLNDELARNKIDYLNADKRKASIVGEQTKLREDWNKQNADQSAILKEEFVFDESKCTCPTCKQKLPEENISEQRTTLENNFNSNKTSRVNTITERLKSITDSGKELSKEINDLDKRLDQINTANESLIEGVNTLTGQLTALETEHGKLTANDTEALNTALQSSEELATMKAKIESIEAEIEALNTPEQLNELKQKKILVQGEIDLLNKQLSTKEQIEKTKTRIAQLEQEEKNLAQQIADIEKVEFVIERFERAKSDEVEKRVNDRFKHVRFKLFEKQINGGEVPCCHTLYKGVPWSDLNTAGKIWAGLDIISVLNEHYDVKAPIFLDNRESTTDIPEIDAQIINLIVSPADEKLRVEARQLAEAV